MYIFLIFRQLVRFSNMFNILRHAFTSIFVLFFFSIQADTGTVFKNENSLKILLCGNVFVYNRFCEKVNCYNILEI